jgi:ligand-binding sensor domain-containing protein
MALAGNIWRTWAWLAISLAVLPGLRLAAEPQANWRTYTAVDGLRETRTTSVAVSPQGNIWVTHGDASMLSRLDGYNISTIPAPIGNLRIYESREGQLWSLYTDGLQEFKGGRWITYSINDIRAEFQSDLLRRVRLIPLQPIGRDRVLFLLAENLMEWNAALGRTRLVLEVSHTRLERFLDMTEASDGGAWITGRRGVVRISSSLSSTNGALAWKEHLFSDELRVENGLRPIEDESGGITLVADSLLTRKRVPVYFDGREAWQAIITMEDSIRKSWRGLDNSFWGLTINALLRLDMAPQSYVERQELGAGRFYDIAAETNGVFWVATVEGLTRHAPSLWHTPLEAQNINVMVHSLNQDAAGRLWCISANAMGMSQQQQWRLFGFEDESEQFTEPAGAPFFLPSGLVALNINNQFRLFSPKTEEFQTPTHPSNRELELVGQLKDGALVLKSVDARQPQVGYRLDTFDGRRFQHLMEASNTAALGSEVFFASTVGEETWVGGSAGLAVFRNRQWLNLMPEAAVFRMGRSAFLP